jgi:hypothetical protein
MAQPTPAQIVEYVLREMHPALGTGDGSWPNHIVDAADLIGFIEGKGRNEVRHTYPERFDMDDAERYGL